MNHKPLVQRTFKYKNADVSFFCPLCRTERAITTSPRLKKIHFLQIIVAIIVISALTFQWLGIVGTFFFFFLFWGSVEASLRTVFKKEIPCPHCGFDASWYKKDVKVARERVKTFWDARKNEEKVS